MLLIIFCFFLLIPLTRIKTAKYRTLNNENRLATFKPTIKITKNNESFFNNNYINDWNRYIGDRIGMRKDFTNLKIIISNNILSASTKKIYKNEWMFFNKEIPFNKITLLTKEQLREYGKSIKNLIKWCKNNHVKCYIVNMPSRNNFIREKIGLDNDLVRKSDIGNQLNEYLKQQKIGFQIIDLWDKMFALNKNEMLFYKQDWHQTNLTSFLLYNEVMKAIKNDFKTIILPNENDFNIYYSKIDGVETSLCDKTFFECDRATEYKMINHKDNYEIKIHPLAQEDLFKTYYAKGNNLSMLLLGRSYANRTDKYFAYGFKNYYRKGIWHNQFAEQHCKNLKQYNFDRGCFSQEHLEGILKMMGTKPDVIVLFDYDLEYSKDF